MIIGLPNTCTQTSVASTKWGERMALGWLLSSLLLRNSAGCPLIWGLIILLILRGAPEDFDPFLEGVDSLTGFLVGLCMSAFPYPPLGVRMPTMV
jgi:hypothetical protein